MNRNLLKQNQVSICHENSCINATGKNADMIAKGATAMLLLLGIGFLIKEVSK